MYLKKLFILCSICFISSCAEAYYTNYYTYNHVRRMKNNLTIKGLIKTKGSEYGGYGGYIYQERATSYEVTPLDFLLQKDNTYCFQKSDSVDKFWIERTLVSGIDWENAFNSSIEIKADT